SIGPSASSGLDGQVVVEPIASLMSGLHLISKAGLRLRYQSMPALPDAALPLADPDVFNRYAARHPRALFLEEGVELSPLSDVLVYGGARITSDPAFSLRHPDHGASFVSARTAIGRLTLSAGVPWNWFLAGRDRA